MKLRNKIDGTITEGDVWIKTKFHREPWLCASIAELEEHWEDYVPKEPLIKDEKIRKAVRAWAEACDVERCHYDGDGNFATRWHGITLDGSVEQIDEGTYTIAELCGEEE